MNIGFVGTQEKISATRHKADTKKTEEIIRAKKAVKVFLFRLAKQKQQNKKTYLS